MLLFSPPPCDLFPGSRLKKQTHLSSPHFSLSPWSAAPSRSPRLTSSHQRISSPAQPRPAPQPSKPPTMTFHSGTPQSPSPFFEPTLSSIPEVFEYEPLDEQASSTLPSPIQEAPEVLTPESSTIAQPKLSRATSRSAIIQSPPRRTVSALSVAKVLRRVLEADLMRRRKIMRVYLKAIMFLKFLWRANERYGTIVLTSGMHVPR